MAVARPCRERCVGALPPAAHGKPRNPQQPLIAPGGPPPRSVPRTCLKDRRNQAALSSLPPPHRRPSESNLSIKRQSFSRCPPWLATGGVTNQAFCRVYFGREFKKLGIQPHERSHILRGSRWDGMSLGRRQCAPSSNLKGNAHFVGWQNGVSNPSPLYFSLCESTKPLL